MSPGPDERAKPRPAGSRRVYRTPRLERLGTLVELTAAVVTAGKNDHAGPHATFSKT